MIGSAFCTHDKKPNKENHRNECEIRAKAFKSPPIGKHATLKVNKVRSADMCYESQIKRIFQALHLQHILILFEKSGTFSESISCK